MKILKKFVSLFLLTQVLMLWANPADAQYEWAPVGATWYINALSYTSPTYDKWQKYYTVESTGDTIVGGYNGRKVGDHIMIQNGYKVYVWWQDTIRLQYDFGLEVGDTAVFDLFHYDTINRFQSFIVEEIDTIEVDGFLLKRFSTVGNDFDGQACYCWQYFFTEKIGEYGTIVNEEAFAYQTADHIPPFVRCYEDEDLLWKHVLFVLDCDYSNPSAIHFPLLGSVSISPNPARSVIHLRVDAPLPHWYEIRVNILGSDGVVQLSMPFVLSSQTMDIPVSSLSSGIYFLQLTDPAGQVLSVEKVVIE